MDRNTIMDIRNQLYRTVCLSENQTANRLISLYGTAQEEGATRTQELAIRYISRSFDTLTYLIENPLGTVEHPLKVSMRSRRNEMDHILNKAEGSLNR